jgi:hypothetical protein
MTEWASVLLTFWALWLIDGLKLPPAERFGVAGRGGRARFVHGRLLWPAWLPGGWRTTVADVPFALSPRGICNRPVGAAGRPMEAPATATAWAWEDIRETGVDGGWITINGRRFCRDTGHLRANQILGLARLTEPSRTARVGWWIHRWLRPAHLRRRVRVLEARTEGAVALNEMFLATALLVTVYLAANAATRVPAAWADVIARSLPLLIGWLLLLHFIAVLFAWRAVRRLKAATEDKRGMALFSAVLLPPQALRLRGLAGEGWFPPQHPLAHALAFARKPELAQLAFQALGDLRWPIGTDADPALAREIATWHRATLKDALALLLAAADLKEAELFLAPRADGAASCQYCPRCGSQFVNTEARCPHGVGLQPVRRA